MGDQAGLSLFTGELCTEAGEAYRECLEGRERLPVIHGEGIIPNLPELEQHRLLIPRTPWLAGIYCSHQLEILH